MIRAVLAFGLLSACAALPEKAPRAEWDDINAAREVHGLPLLARSAAADRAAAIHARDMARNGFFDHRGSNGSTHGQRLAAEGCGPGAENIAMGDYTGLTVFDAWMTSPGHRRNILDRDMQVYGLAHEGPYWVLTLSTSC